MPDGDAPNILRITGAPHRLTPARIASAADAWRGRFAALPRPLVALIVGGATHAKPFPVDLAATLGRDVSRMASDTGGAVLVATSRRTGVGAERALIGAIDVPYHSFLWSAGGDNPYFGYLALADAIVVTGDSVSMCSEACATPATVYIYAPEGMVGPKHARLHRHLYETGLAKPFDGHFTPAAHPPLNAAGEIAQKIDMLLVQRQWPSA